MEYHYPCPEFMDQSPTVGEGSQSPPTPWYTSTSTPRSEGHPLSFVVPYYSPCGVPKSRPMRSRRLFPSAHNHCSRFARTRNSVPFHKNDSNWGPDRETKPHPGSDSFLYNFDVHRDTPCPSRKNKTRKVNRSSEKQDLQTATSHHNLGTGELWSAERLGPIQHGRENIANCQAFSPINGRGDSTENTYQSDTAYHNGPKVLSNRLDIINYPPVYTMSDSDCNLPPELCKKDSGIISNQNYSQYYCSPKEKGDKLSSIIPSANFTPLIEEHEKTTVTGLGDQTFWQTELFAKENNQCVPKNVQERTTVHNLICPVTDIAPEQKASFAKQINNVGHCTDEERFFEPNIKNSVVVYDTSKTTILKDDKKTYKSFLSTDKISTTKYDEINASFSSTDGYGLDYNTALTSTNDPLMPQVPITSLIEQNQLLTDLLSQVLSGNLDFQKDLYSEFLILGDETIFECAGTEVVKFPSVGETDCTFTGDLIDAGRTERGNVNKSEGNSETFHKNAVVGVKVTKDEESMADYSLRNHEYDISSSKDVHAMNSTHNDSEDKEAMLSSISKYIFDEPDVFADAYLIDTDEIEGEKVEEYNLGENTIDAKVIDAKLKESLLNRSWGTQYETLLSFHNGDNSKDPLLMCVAPNSVLKPKPTRKRVRRTIKNVEVKARKTRIKKSPYKKSSSDNGEITQKYLGARCEANKHVSEQEDRSKVCCDAETQVTELDEVANKIVIDKCNDKRDAETQWEDTDVEIDIEQEQYSYITQLEQKCNFSQENKHVPSNQVNKEVSKVVISSQEPIPGQCNYSGKDVVLCKLLEFPLDLPEKDRYDTVTEDGNETEPERKLPSISANESIDIKELSSIETNSHETDSKAQFDPQELKYLEGFLQQNDRTKQVSLPCTTKKTTHRNQRAKQGSKNENNSIPNIFLSALNITHTPIENSKHHGEFPTSTEKNEQAEEGSNLLPNMRRRSKRLRHVSERAKNYYLFGQETDTVGHDDLQQLPFSERSLEGNDKSEGISCSKDLTERSQISKCSIKQEFIPVISENLSTSHLPVKADGKNTKVPPGNVSSITRQVLRKSKAFSEPPPKRLRTQSTTHQTEFVELESPNTRSKDKNSANLTGRVVTRSTKFLSNRKLFDVK